jgi:hypothetical protein
MMWRKGFKLRPGILRMHHSCYRPTHCMETKLSFVGSWLVGIFAAKAAYLCASDCTVSPAITPNDTHKAARLMERSYFPGSIASQLTWLQARWYALLGRFMAGIAECTVQHGGVAFYSKSPRHTSPSPADGRGRATNL